jgi:Carboxypeptidase regulatory-like domain
MLPTFRHVATAVAVAVTLYGVLLPAPVGAQGLGAIAGVVRDTSGGILPGVTVEAASPALIEKARTVITDDQGVYRIVDLRPGIYGVTFTLPGFTVVKREGIELTGNFTATVNAELKVGGLEETVTVSGQSPVVDIQNVVQQRVITRDVLEALPSGKSIQSMTALIPGLSAGLQNHDVGGTVGDQPIGTAIHGSRANDQHMFYDGMRTNNLNYLGSGGGASQSIFFNPAAIQEISMEVGNLAIQSETGGVVINAIPKDGGNVFRGMVIVNGTNSDFQGNNLSNELRALGLQSVTTIKGMWDLNAAVGGPIQRDKLWFHGSYRRWGNENYVASRYFAVDPLAWTHTDDLSRPAYEQNLHRSVNFRLTWQVNTKNKVSFAGERQDQCICYSGLGSYGGIGNVSPEASNFINSSPNAYGQIRWTNAVSNKLLLEAGTSWNMMNWNSAPQPGVGPDVVSVTELRTNFTYRSPTVFNGRRHNDAVYASTNFGMFAASYVTGSHSFRAGTLLLHAQPYGDVQTNADRNYQFFDGLPRAVVLRATPLRIQNRVKADIGTYAQDQWTIKQLTLNLGVRYTYLNAYVPRQLEPAGSFVPARDYAEVRDVAVWHDLTPRLGGSFDLFGNGKTALKANLARYLGGEGPGAANGKNLASLVDSTATRAWSDGNANYVPDCDLLNPEENGECGPLSNRNFGKPSLTSTTYDDNVLHGYGKRHYNWEAAAGVQHELFPRVSVSAMYFHRWFGNFLVNDNRAVNPSDYDPFCIAVPVDSRLPGGGGNQLCGFYDINPAKFGRIDNYVTFSKQYGRVDDVYDGVDLSVNARLTGGALVQGGLNIGRERTDLCDIVDKTDIVAAVLPYSTAGASSLVPGLSGLPSPSRLFCRVTPPFRPEMKVSASYPLPWWRLQVSGTLQSIPGPEIAATYIAANSQIAPSLGRNLAAGTAGIATLQLVEPGTLFGGRLNQVDMRVMKMFRISSTNVRAIVDLYNLFNASPVTSLNQRYGPAWQQPFIILPARFAKFGVQVDF